MKYDYKGLLYLFMISWIASIVMAIHFYGAFDIVDLVTGFFSAMPAAIVGSLFMNLCNIYEYLSERRGD